MRKKIKNKIKRIIHLTALISFIIITVIDNCYEYFYFTPRLEKGIDYENTLNIVAEIDCRYCGGTGRDPEPLECFDCNGRGIVECNECEGKGYIDKNDC